ncbi:hypothetical protein [Hoeflea sp. EC-HK425]|uniref:hypothetical protein n=1 Tax=Hoeflea sp. EC-HK425 TaxID=2038388 RepID=UPI00125ADAAE|nr:hypothetical protein [Hoeflea sp. EC-HK425]VVT29530.1 conserved membrane hypothetical protein [Hoeflea sp. EC-HK425]
MPAIVHRFSLGIPEFDLFSSLSFGCALVASLILLYIFLAKFNSILRVSFFTAALSNIFFQWPMFLISDVLQESLENPYWHFFVVQISVFVLLSYGILTTSNFTRAFHPEKISFRRGHLFFSIFLGALLVFLYLRKVPFDCTALYAVLFDPQVTLLAREVSIKFAGSFIATSSFGAFTNALAPVVIALSVAMIWHALRTRNILQLVLFPLVILAAVFVCMLSGAKGLLLPSIIVILVASILWNRSFIRKGIAAAASMLLLFGSLVVFEVVRDRGWSEAGAYPFGQCTAQLGACDQGKELILSLYKRDASLGLYKDRIQALEKELKIACEKPKEGAPNQSPWSYDDLDIAPKTERAVDEAARSYLEGVIYRALVIPTQVAAWHFLYVEEMGSPGFAAMPFARRLTGSSVNMPELVYQKYGSVFAHGDKTSTSTSPTSFLLAYPAYLGVVGLVLSLLAVIITDIIVSVLLLRVPNALYPIGVGLAAVISFNFILSDFVTVMLSHGGAVAIALMAFFAVTRDGHVLRNALDLLKITRKQQD